MGDSLKEKVALITGAGRGIGAATAKLFAREGAKVFITSRTESELKYVSDSITKDYGPGKVHYAVADITQEDQVQQLFQKAYETLGSLDILVNNAGGIVVKPFTDLTLDDWRFTMNVNLDAAFLCSREAMRRMKFANQGGCIINISSLAGIRGTPKIPGFGAYTPAKHAVVGLTEIMNLEGKEHGIRVNCVAPGAVDTRMLREAAPGFSAEAAPEDIAYVILSIADEERSKKLNGAVIEVNTND